MSRWLYCGKYTIVGTFANIDRFFGVFPIPLKIDGEVKRFTKLGKESEELSSRNCNSST